MHTVSNQVIANLVVDHTDVQAGKRVGICGENSVAYLFWITRSVVEQSKPSVLWAAGSPSLFEFGASPSAKGDNNGRQRIYCS